MKAKTEDCKMKKLLLIALLALAPIAQAAVQNWTATYQDDDLAHLIWTVDFSVSFVDTGEEWIALNFDSASVYNNFQTAEQVNYDFRWGEGWLLNGEEIDVMNIEFSYGQTTSRFNATTGYLRNEEGWSVKQHNTIALVQAVPVPAAAWLFSSALIGLFGVKRK